MADFVDEEADVSSGSESGSGSGSESGSESDSPRKEKSRRAVIDSSEEGMLFFTIEYKSLLIYFHLISMPSHCRKKLIP